MGEMEGPERGHTLGMFVSTSTATSLHSGNPAPQDNVYLEIGGLSAVVSRSRNEGSAGESGGKCGLRRI
jgi:hypothetical protein